MSKLFTIDTNILIYAADLADSRKKRLSEALFEKLEEHGSILPLQCLNEFYNATTKKDVLSAKEAQLFIEEALVSLRIIPSQSEDAIAAMQIHQMHKVQFYDALLWTTARRAGCTIFLTEDGQPGRNFGGITLHDPFTPGFDLVVYSTNCAYRAAT